MKWVHPLAALALAVVIILAFAYLRAPEATRVRVGQQAPELDLLSYGVPYKSKLSSFRGHPVLLVFFNADCPNCLRQMRLIDLVYRRDRAKGLAVLGVSTDTDRERLRGFLATGEITFLILEDPGGKQMEATYSPRHLPEAYLIDPHGRVDAVFQGWINWRSPEITEQIQKYFKSS